ncbi:MAG TPA: NADH-quinone oxidoreductase subunit H [Kineosporiaceae bacterium]|nr:NADH-quinone oxidoreductase subunit H [Kineosporiaceae bacterium]
MSGLTAVLAAVAQPVLIAAGAPLLIGGMRTVRARLEGRVGGGVLQPWRDLLKLLRKEPVSAAGTSWVFTAAPVVLMATSLVIAVVVPYLSTQAVLPGAGDLFAVVAILLVGTVALTLAGLDTGTAFGGMGSSREITVAALVEPTVLLSVFALSVPAGSSNLAAIIRGRLDDPSTVASPTSLLALVALVVVTIAETGRLPVDNPATHLELTMIHEAMVLEYAGRDLALVEWASWMRLSVLLGLIANLFVPWGIAGAGAGPGWLLPAAVVLAVKVGLLGALLAAAEVFLAKIRLFRVPELLAGSLVLAFLAVSGALLLPAVSQ